jgi:hypothetical protein
MARMRSIKPEFWLDRKLARCVSRDARLLYIGMWNYADESGRLHGDPSVIKGQVFPYDDVDVQCLLDELVAASRVVPYTFDEDPYLHLPMLSKHQRLDPVKTPSRLPDPVDPRAYVQVRDDSEKIPDYVGKIPNHSGKIAAKHVASSKGQVASGKEHVAGGMLPAQGSFQNDPPPASPNGAAPIPAAESLNQRAQRLTRTYTDCQPVSNFPAVMGIVKKAMAAHHDDDEISSALLRLVNDGRGVTTETLRIELQGLPAQRGQPKRSTTDERVEVGLELVAKYQKEEEWAAQKQLRS